jgi:hypothetical protein
MMAVVQEEQPMVARRGHRPGLVTVLALVGVGLLANAAVLLLRPSSGDPGSWLARQALAQADAPRMLGARGLYMAPMQLGQAQYGLCVMDVEAQTFAVYRVQPDPARLRLVAVRAFRNDLLLSDLNNENPTPRDVQMLVERQRERERIEGKKPAGTSSEPPPAAPEK